MDKVKHRWQKEDKARLDSAMRELMSTADGRRLVRWVLEISAAMGVNPFTANALQTSFRCGEQNVGQQVMAHMIEVDPDGYLKMLKEMADERAARDAELAAVESRGRDRDSLGDYTDPRS